MKRLLDWEFIFYKDIGNMLLLPTFGYVNKWEDIIVGVLFLKYSVGIKIHKKSRQIEL